MCIVRFIALLLFAAMIVTQEVLEQYLPEGQFTEIYIDKRPVPRYYLCGAEVTLKKEITPEKKTSEIVCNRKRTRLGKRYCSWQTKWTIIPAVTEWVRSNGITFKYCHFQKWGDQFQLTKNGNWQWQGMKMCPENQFIYGYQIKATPRDGIAGLIIFCKDMFNSKIESSQLVFDGEGGWWNKLVSSGFATGFKAKVKDEYLTGIGLQFASVPMIIDFDLKYKLTESVNAVPELIQNILVSNYAQVSMYKEIQFTKDKEYSRSWNNEKSELHSYSLQKLLSHSLRTSLKVKVPYVKLNIDNDFRREVSTSRMDQASEKFNFGTVDTFKVGQKHKDKIEISPCTRYSFEQIVYNSEADVPYEVQMSYSNGYATERDKINGFFRGVIVSQSQIITRSVKIC